jgi:hypothetical protein
MPSLLGSANKLCFAVAVLCRAAGLGILSGLSDDVILGVLELLSAADLARVGLVSKAFYCFAHTNDLWKGLVLQVCTGAQLWREGGGQVELEL